ncbi:hypothetical protein SKAU_G00206840 [Synaphobranchus kaupii]|uniref:ribonuclease H n=1 Tax=Synaphobranchus kaupii TaxID=118154 RepID=A0A9Q1ITM6_SYNKA|nr:hypothetical protein SKAU_G00206840 [Synaphobranchus kaupii]
MHNLTLTADQKKDPDAILDALEDYFKPTKNVIYERYVFGCCKQETDEPIDGFITRLRERAATCEYRGLRDEMLRDRLVLGISSEGTRRRLLRERDLTLPVAVEICRLAEVTEKRLRTIDGIQTDSINAMDKQRRYKAQESSTTRQEVTNPHINLESVPGEVHFDLDPGVTPVQCAPRNVPVALRARVKAQLEKYESDGHITPITEPTPWISNMVVVNRKEKIRPCIDPKFLNQALRRSHYLMPTLEDVLYKLPKARIFTLVDAREAFLQCKLDDESSWKTTFWTPWGRMRWLKLPFGVSVAPEIYQRKQHELLGDLSGVEPIADDILVVGCGDSDIEAERDHDSKLLALMERCREVKLRLSVQKLQFKLKVVQFHGHILSSQGLRIDPEKTRAVLDMPTPTDAKAVQRFIGFVTYLAKFLPRLSEVCKPLHRLLDKDSVRHWLPKHEQAVQEIKRLVSTTPVLKYYDVTRPVTVQSDASKNGLGCCIMQGGQPVAFASRALTPTEQNYAQIEKECLSIVFTCQRFHHYLYGRETITAETDHKPLISIVKKPLLCAPKRLQSMLMQLQNYNLEVTYKPGPEMYISDTLSRATTQARRSDVTHTQHTVCSVEGEQAAFTHIDQAQHLNVTDHRVSSQDSESFMQEGQAGWHRRMDGHTTVAQHAD